MGIFVGDIEGDGLLDEITKVWCIILKQQGKDKWYIFSDHTTEWRGHKVYPLNKVAKFINKKVDKMVMHNLLGYDLEVLRRFCGVVPTILPDTLSGQKVEIVDSLVVSRYNRPDRRLPKGCPTHQEVAGQAAKKPVGPHGLYAWGYRVGLGKPEVLDWATQPLDTYLDRGLEDTKINDLAYTMMLEEM